MSREIKFRAWDKDTKDWAERAQRERVCFINNSLDYIWCQYTGLKDKNGVEIYEGDIVKVANGNFKGTVDYCSTYTSYLFVDTGTIKYESENIGDYHVDLLEIIGNIYENPELLDKEE